MPFRKYWSTQPAGRSKFFVLPLPGGILRVENPRETLRPSRIAQGGSDRLPKVPLAGQEGNIINENHERSGADSRSPISIRGPLGGSVSVPGLLMVLH